MALAVEAVVVVDDDIAFVGEDSLETCLVGFVLEAECIVHIGPREHSNP